LSAALLLFFTKIVVAPVPHLMTIVPDWPLSVNVTEFPAIEEAVYDASGLTLRMADGNVSCSVPPMTFAAVYVEFGDVTTFVCGCPAVYGMAVMAGGGAGACVAVVVVVEVDVVLVDAGVADDFLVSRTAAVMAPAAATALPPIQRARSVVRFTGAAPA
jgi:hypothetical protein